MTFYPPPLQQLTDHPLLSLTLLTPLSSTIDIDIVRMLHDSLQLRFTLQG